MVEKKIDSDWKKRAEEEKVKLEQEEAPPIPYKVTFSNFVSEYTMQAMISLGILEHPVDKSAKIDLANAKYAIDTLEMIEEKTKNNLTEEESSQLKNVLHQLRMAYVHRMHNPTLENSEEI
jgi:hypothetical protein